MTSITPATPVAIIGGGPAGLAAAAHLAERGLPFLVLEAGPQAGHSVLSWGHVQLFSPWRYCVDKAALRLLEPTGWKTPDPESYPTGRALVERYLAPLAAHPAIAPHLRLGRRVAAITREGDLYKVIDVLARDVEVRGIFSDWAAPVTFYANCLGLK